MQNYSLLAWKMSELWLFEILTSEAEVEAKAEAEVKILLEEVKIYYHAKFQPPSLKNE